VVEVSRGVLTWSNSSISGGGLTEDISMVLEEQMVYLEEQTRDWQEEFVDETVVALEIKNMMDKIYKVRWDG
jgi:hypothetical protein